MLEYSCLIIDHKMDFKIQIQEIQWNSHAIVLHLLIMHEVQLHVSPSSAPQLGTAKPCNAFTVSLSCLHSVEVLLVKEKKERKAEKTKNIQNVMNTYNWLLSEHTDSDDNITEAAAAASVDASERRSLMELFLLSFSRLFPCVAALLTRPTTRGLRRIKYFHHHFTYSFCACIFMLILLVHCIDSIEHKFVDDIEVEYHSVCTRRNFT
jgi:hypothetical protein